MIKYKKTSVFDTWAKIPSGVFRGNLVSPGSFADCVNFKHRSEINGVGTIQGKHCMIDFAAKAEPSATHITTGNGFDWTEMYEKMTISAKIINQSRFYIFRGLWINRM